MQRRHLCRALIGLSAVLVGLGTGPSIAVAQTERPEYEIRYAVFTTKPKGVDPYREGEISPVFQRLQNGSELELGVSPDAFMDGLRKGEPNYDFTLVLSGKQRGKAGSPISIKAGPTSKDPHQLTLKDQFTLVPKEANFVDVMHDGEMSHLTPNGKTGFEWRGGRPTERMLQRTYSMGICSFLTPDRHLVYVYHIVRMDR